MAYDPATGFRTKLPNEADLIREEVADVVALPPARRAQMLALACRTGMQLLALQPPEQRLRSLHHRDPLSSETEAALARLRERFASRHGRTR